MKRSRQVVQRWQHDGGMGARRGDIDARHGTTGAWRVTMIASSLSHFPSHVARRSTSAHGLPEHGTARPR